MRDHILPEYSRMKARFPDNVFLWRVGDFYKVFNGDAVKVSECLDTTLLNREGVLITGGIWYSLSFALARLVKAGYTVAYADGDSGRQSIMPVPTTLLLKIKKEGHKGHKGHGAKITGHFRA